jgi:hypothetical protein
MDAIYEKQRRSRKHIHQYQKVDMGMMGLLWKCVDAYCSHYMPKHQESLLVGRASLCNECRREEIILDIESMSVHIPICTTCKLKDEGIPAEAFEEFIESKETFMDKLK